MKFTPATVLLGIPSANLSNVHTCIIIIIDAVTLVPPITTCPGQTVMFNCTSYGAPITWSVFTPNMNYTNLAISKNQAHRESMDGVIMADLISLDASTMPITIVSSLTVNVTAELEGSKVQCLGFTANGRDTEIQSEFIHITGDYYLLIRRIKDFLPLLKWRVLRSSSLLDFQGQMGESHCLKSYNINTIAMSQAQ